jgi:molecular chaperone DnaJ
MGQGAGGGFSAEGMTMEDIFSQFGDVFGDGGSPFDTFFRGGGRAQTGGGQRGSNIRVKVGLTLEEIQKGVNKKIKINKELKCSKCSGSGAKSSSAVKTCSTCQGSGYVRQVRSTFLGHMQTTVACNACGGSGQMITDKCTNCHGSGKAHGNETIEINIPGGVEDGMQLSMRGKGNAGAKGGPAGDLLILIEEKDHRLFKRDGNNIIYDLYINFADAALGSQVEIPTLGPKVKIKIPPGTQSGKLFRLKGKGLPEVQGYGTGDQIIHTNVWTPKRLTNEEKALLEQMKDMPNFQPNPGKAEKGFFERMKDYFK